MLWIALGRHVAFTFLHPKKFILHASRTYQYKIKKLEHPFLSNPNTIIFHFIYSQYINFLLSQTT